MKKLTILSLILVLAIALTACGSSKQATEPTASATVPTTATVPAETTAPQPLELTEWSMSASTWSSPNGATIHISATPSYYEEGHQAEFIVRLESDDIATSLCQWDGNAYTASVDLNAANGYCYYIILTGTDGTSQEVAVNTPAEPVNPAFIDMEAALTSYCNIIVEESAFENGTLTLSAGNVQVQVPTITNAGESISCQDVTLVLSFQGEELAQHSLTLTETETDGLYAAALSGVTFTLPEMENEQKVELTLNVILSNGYSLSSYGGNWIYNSEGLLPVVG